MGIGGQRRGRLRVPGARCTVSTSHPERSARRREVPQVVQAHAGDPGSPQECCVIGGRPCHGAVASARPTRTASRRRAREQRALQSASVTWMVRSELYFGKRISTAFSRRCTCRRTWICRRRKSRSPTFRRLLRRAEYRRRRTGSIQARSLGSEAATMLRTASGAGNGLTSALEKKPACRHGRWNATRSRTTFGGSAAHRACPPCLPERESSGGQRTCGRPQLDASCTLCNMDQDHRRSRAARLLAATLLPAGGERRPGSDPKGARLRDGPSRRGGGLGHSEENGMTAPYDTGGCQDRSQARRRPRSGRPHRCRRPDPT